MSVFRPSARVTSPDGREWEIYAYKIKVRNRETWDVDDPVTLAPAEEVAWVVSGVLWVVLLIPRFLILKELGLYNSYAGMIIPIIIDAAGIFIMKQFFESIPVSVEEAARIYGAGVFRTFWTIVLPMARPALITLFILSFQGSWNEFGHFLIARQDADLDTLTVGVASLTSGQLGSGNQYPLKLAAAVLMSIPVAALFFVFQRRIMSTAQGGEKG